MQELIYIGIAGNVVALDRNTGREVWRRKIPGSGHVTNVVLDGDRILASAQGVITCLNASDGMQVWHNGLSGLGFGFVSIAVRSSSMGTPNTAPAEQIAAAESRRRSNSD